MNAKDGNDLVKIGMNYVFEGKADKGIQLTPLIRFSLERAIEYISNDELVEATPKNIRLRKRTLDSNARQREKKRLVQELEAV